MIFESILAVLISTNLYIGCKQYEQWKTKADKIADYDDVAASAVKMMAENRKLRDEIDALTAPDMPWQYIFNGQLYADDLQRLEEWLSDKDSAKFSYQCRQYAARFGGKAPCKVKFATEDRNLAMLFKLTFGGAQ